MSFFSRLKNFLFIPRDRILSAVSEDGINWKRESGIRQEYGGIHNTTMAYYSYVHQPEDFCGEYEMYYHSSSYIDGAWQGRIIRSRSKDGLKWIDFQKPVVSGGVSELIDRQVRAPFLLKGEKGWRLYFSARGVDGVTRIFSSFSEDREEWQTTPEPVIEPQDCQSLRNEYWGNITDLTDPCVVRLSNNRLRLYFSCIYGDLQNQMIGSAVSKDGKRWEIEAGCRIPAGPGLEDPCVCNACVIPYSDGWRIYYRRAEIYPLWNTIYTAYSSDGINFDKGMECLRYQRWNFNERNAVAFPFVMPLHNQRYRMYYTGYWGLLFDRASIQTYTSKFNSQNKSL